MSLHPVPPPHILDGKLEPELRDSADERVTVTGPADTERAAQMVRQAWRGAMASTALRRLSDHEADMRVFRAIDRAVET
ncbi:MAG TPA: hypothetical protein DDW89_09045 [Gammaproteobacteria bacterium]|nr:hypothetical protein [Gammaproteobacteria bacterium]